MSFVWNNRNLNRLIFVLAAIVLAFMFRYRFGGPSGDDYKRVINGDGKGYYAYLPAVFIYHDMTFSFFEKDQQNFGYQYSNTFLLNHDKKNLNKYTCGEAILLIPFFLAAMVYSKFMWLPVDGYNGAFHVFCALGTLTYFVLGLFLSKKVMQRHALSGRSIALSLVALTFGTNILNYVVFESSMSHVYSFFTIALNVYLAKRFFESPSLKVILLGGLTLGLIILIRPINGIIVFAYPFLAGDKNFFAIVKEKFKYFLLAGTAACAVIFVQLILWKLEIGNFLVYGYKNEGFYFNQVAPVFDYLLSFKRGAFIYSPILLLSLIGFLRMPRREALWLFIFLFLVVYVHASWWSWYYGDGFGERPLIDFYIFFALLLAFFFEMLGKTVVRIAGLAALIVLVALHQVFFFQYIRGIIHPYSMNYEKFKFVFLKTSERYRNLFKCETEDFYHPHGVFASDSVFASLIDTNENVSNKLTYSKNKIRQGAYMDISNDIYPVTYAVKTDTSWLFKARYAEMEFDYMQPKADTAAADVLLCVTLHSNVEGAAAYFNANQLEGKDFNTPYEWRHAFERIKIGIPESTGMEVHAFVNNPRSRAVYIKNFKIRIVEAKP